MQLTIGTVQALENREIMAQNFKQIKILWLDDTD